MRKMLLLAAIAVALAVPAPALAGEWYKPGQKINYRDLVENPDITIQYVNYAPGTKTLTMFLSRADGSRPADRAQVDLALGESTDVFVKNECGGAACRAYVVTLKFSEYSAEDKQIKLDHDVKVVPGSHS